MIHPAKKRVSDSYRGVEINQLKLINNKVLCKKLYTNVKEKTKSGIIYPESMNENQRLHQNADGIFEVVAIPEILTMRPGKWKTYIEVKKGDVIWVDRTEALNSESVFGDDDVEYKLVDYYAIIVIKRLIHDFEWSNPKQVLIEDDLTYEIIPVNGFILCSDIFYKPDYVTPGDKPIIDARKATIEFVGKRNKCYYVGNKPVDKDSRLELKKGQIIALEILNKNDNEYFTTKREGLARRYLEYEQYARFNGNKMYFYVQRRQINALLEK